MLPYPARPVAPSEQTPSAKRGSGARAAASTGIQGFIPPLAPSPPPKTPPTVHSRVTAGTGSAQTVSASPVEPNTAELQPGSFSSILRGETLRDSSGRAYHLRGTFNPVQAARRLVSSRPAQAAVPREDEQEDVEHSGEEHPETKPRGNENPETAHSEDEGGDETAKDQPGETQPNDGGYPQQEAHPNDAQPAQSDAIRRIAVTVVTAAALGAAYGLTRTASGWPQINHSPGSVLDPAGSLLGTYAWIWLAWIPVLAGAAGYAAWQWLPSQRDNPRQVWTGPISAGSSAVAALWLWAAQSGNSAAAFWLAALGIGIGLAAIHLSNTWAPEPRGETAAADLPAAVFLGVSSVALLAGLGSWLTELEANVAGWGPEPWALIALFAVVIGATTVSMTDRGHLAAALTIVVGLTGIGFARLLTQEASAPAAAGAFFGAFLILVSAGSRRHQVDHAQRRRQREWLKAEASVPAAGEAPEAVRT